MERGQHDQAIDAFNGVLKDDPTDPDGLAGLQQARQAQLLAEIDRLRELAEQQESDDEWTAALATYDTVLGIDPSLRFARTAKRDRRSRGVDRIHAEVHRRSGATLRRQRIRPG